MSMSSKKRVPFPATVAAALAYAVLVVLMTLPASLHLSQQLIGNNIDNWIFYWNDWWLGQAISEGRSWFDTPYLFHPNGTTLIAHSNAFQSSLFALGLKPLFGPVAAYNLTFLLGLWLGAIGMFLLVRDITGQPSAAFLAGFIFTFAPYHLTQLLAHPHLGSIHWWPFYIFFLRRASSGRSWVNVVGAGLCAALTVWAGLQLAILLGLWTAVYLLWLLWPARVNNPDQSLALRPLSLRLVVIGLLAFALSLPVVWPLLQNSAELVSTAAALDERAKTQTDLLAYGLPPTLHPLWGEAMVPFYEKFAANRANMPYIGYTVLALALLGLWGQQRREASFWFANGLLWLVLAAGATLLVNGRLYPHIPLPYRWLENLFPFSALRSPDRFNLLLVLALAVLAGLGAGYLWQRKRRLLLPLALGVALEYLFFPIPAWELPPRSPFLETMAQDGMAYAVIDYPFGYSRAKQWLYYQTIHEKPLVEGHMSRYSAATYRFIIAQPLLRALYSPDDLPPFLPAELLQPPPMTNLGPDLRALRTAGFRYILFHLPGSTPADYSRFHEVLPFVPIYQDETLAVYDLNQPFPWQYGDRPVSLSPEVTLLRAEAELSASGNALQIRLLTTLSGPYEHSLTCQLQLTDTNDTTGITFFEPEISWQKHDLALQTASLPLPPSLPAGQYPWQITCPNAFDYHSPTQLVINPAGSKFLTRHPTNIQVGPAILLRGYNWRSEGSDLYLNLQWETRSPVQDDYKRFVHLLDETNAIVAQSDAFPCNWACPTGQWAAGQLVEDEAMLSLAHVPAGHYTLAVGLYSEETGQRLPAQDDNGLPIPDNYIILPEPFIISPGPH